MALSALEKHWISILRDGSTGCDYVDFSVTFLVLYNPKTRHENKYSFIHIPLQTVSIKVRPVGSGGNRKYDLTLQIRGWGEITESDSCRAK